MTDETGTYTIRNIAGGTYTLKASLQGFKEFVQTGIPVVVGNIVRINGRLEVGALSESVTVTSEAPLLKTDKADVSVDLRPEDVTNLPLNQYRNYQTLLNLVPGATPPVFQNAQTDTPGRALSTNINGTNRNNNVTRIDGAASINVWLPHHVGYVAPVETIENVNVSTNNFDAAQGMTGGAATAVQTKSGTNNLKGSAFFFRQQDELNARRGYFDPTKLDSSVSIMGGTVGGPIRRNKLFYFGSLGAQRRAQQPVRHLHACRPRGCGNGDFSEVLALTRPSGFTIRPRATPHGAGRSFFPNAIIPANRISSIARTIQALYPGAEQPPARTTASRTTCSSPRQPEGASATTTTARSTGTATSAHQIWGKSSVMDADVHGPVLPAHRGRRRRGDDGLPLDGRPDLDAEPDAPARRQRRLEQDDPSVGGPGLRHQFRPRDVRHSRAEQRRGHGSRVDRSPALQRHAGVQHRHCPTLGNNAGWTPVWRKEISYTASVNLTKVQRPPRAPHRASTSCG